jgi:hypothetical protein
MPWAGFWPVLVVTSAFMVASSGRMIPAQALLVGIPRPENRTAFLAVNNAVSHVSMGLAPQVAKLFFHDDGKLTGYDKVGYLSAACALAAVGLLGLLHPAKVVRVDTVPAEPEPVAA